MPPSAKGLLFPLDGTLVWRVGHDSSEVANLRESWSCRTTGALQEAVWVALETEGAEMPPVLAALGTDHPLVRTVARLRAESARPLSLAQAAALDGFDTLFIELTGRCNERCVHCYAGSHPGIEARLERAMCEAVLEDAAALGFQRVQFTGGDPLLCSFLPALVARTRQLELPVCEVYTNGLALTDPLLERLRPLQPAFAVSFYSSDAVCHDAITRTPGSQQRTVRAIERVLDAELALRVSIIVMRQNAHTVDATLDYLRGLGVRNLGATGSRAVGRGDLYSGPVGTPWDEDHLPRNAQPDDAASPRSGKLCVTYDGLVVPCIFNRQDVLGDLRERSLCEIVAAPRAPRSDRSAGDELIAACCDRLQCESCRLTAYALRAAAGSR